MFPRHKGVPGDLVYSVEGIQNRHPPFWNFVQATAVKSCQFLPELQISEAKLKSTHSRVSVGRRPRLLPGQDLEKAVFHPSLLEEEVVTTLALQDRWSAALLALNRKGRLPTAHDPSREPCRCRSRQRHRPSWASLAQLLTQLYRHLGGHGKLSTPAESLGHFQAAKAAPTGGGAAGGCLDWRE